MFYEQHTNKHTHNLSQAELEAYKAVHHHTNVSTHDDENKQLGAWVNAQRKAKKKNTLSEERVKKLNEIGFNWEVRKGRRPSIKCYRRHTIRSSCKSTRAC